MSDEVRSGTDLGTGCRVASGDGWSAIACRTPGMSLATDPYVRQHPGEAGLPGGWEARVGLCLFGMLRDEGSWDGNPFDPAFRDNFATGLGSTEEEALTALKADLASTYEGLWD